MSLGAEIRARMSLDSSGVKAGVAQADKHVDKFSHSLKHIAGSLGIAFGAGAIIRGLKNFSQQAIESAIQANHFSKQVNLSTDQFQAFRAEAMLMTGGLEAAQTGLVRFRTAQDEALEGNEKTIKAFQRLGLTLEHIADYSTADLLEAVAKGYREIGDFGSLVDLFGSRNAAKLEQALIALADNGFGALISKQREAGAVLDEELTARFAEAADMMDRFKLKWKNFWVEQLFSMRYFTRSVKADFSAMWAGLKEFGKGVWDPSEAFSPEKIMNAFQAGKEKFGQTRSNSWFDMSYDDKIAARKRKEEQEQQEERNKKLRAGKIADIYAQEETAAMKLEEKRAEAAERESEKRRIADLRAAEKEAEAEEKARFKELRAAGAAGSMTQRYDSLRQIGANVLGSGVLRGGAIDKEAEIARATRATAENTAKLVEKIDRPPVARLSDSGAIF
jgi:hypothetical protein